MNDASSKSNHSNLDDPLLQPATCDAAELVDWPNYADRTLGIAVTRKPGCHLPDSAWDGDPSHFAKQRNKANSVAITAAWTVSSVGSQARHVCPLGADRSKATATPPQVQDAIANDRHIVPTHSRGATRITADAVWMRFKKACPHGPLRHRAPKRSRRPIIRTVNRHPTSQARFRSIGTRGVAVFPGKLSTNQARLSGCDHCKERSR